MNTVIKFLLYFLVVLLLVSWIITMGKSCGNKEAAQVETTAQTNANEANPQDLMEDLEEGVDFTKELEDILDEDEAAQAPASEEIDYSNYDPETDQVEDPKVEAEPDPEPEPAPKPKSEPVKTKPKAISKPPSSGEYYVVSGSYIVPTNANKMEAKLDKMGYDAEVVVFDLSEYYTVLAGRYSTYEAALKDANRLKSSGIDSYVKRRSN